MDRWFFVIYSWRIPYREIYAKVTRSLVFSRSPLSFQGCISFLFQMMRMYIFHVLKRRYYVPQETVFDLAEQFDLVPLSYLVDRPLS
jgi:hypothetical protein